MRNLRQWSITQKLLALGTFVCGLVFVVFGLAFINYRQIDNAAQFKNSVHQSRGKVLEARVVEKLYLQDFSAEYANQLRELCSTLKEDIARLAEAKISKQALEQVKNLSTLAVSYGPSLDAVMAIEQQKKLAVQKMLTAFHQAENSVDVIINAVEGKGFDLQLEGSKLSDQETTALLSSRDCKMYLFKQQTMLQEYMVTRNSKDFETFFTYRNGSSRLSIDALFEAAKTVGTLGDVNVPTKAKEFKEYLSTYADASEQINQFLQSEKAKAAEVDKVGNGIRDTSDLLLTQAEKDTAKAQRNAAITIMIVLAVGAIVLFSIIMVLTRSITGPISKVIKGLNSGSEQVTSASGQVSSASQQLAQGASEQASSLEETSSALEEMASMTRQNADNANQANTMAMDTNTTALEGVESMKRMSEAIDKIKNSASETAKIIKTIDEIAFQTNLLALNAAVEAARAGEAGKGFAVVAEEVRNLARRSAEAAKNTADLIEGATKNAEAGVAVTGEVAKNLQKIQDVASKVATLIAEIAAASKEQSQGIDQVNTAVSEMDKVVQQNAANAEESASASEQLSSQAQELSAMVVELMAIVGGSGSNGTDRHRQNAVLQEAVKAAHKAPPVRTLPASTSKKSTAVLAAPKKHPAAAKAFVARPVKPEEVIPLEDDESKQYRS